MRFQGGFSLRTFLSGVRYSISDEFYLFGEVIKMLVVNKFVVMRFGEDYLPIVAAFSAVSMLTFVASATANALQPVMGVYLGEKNYRRVRDVMRYGLGVTAAIGLVSALAILAFPQVVTLFIGLKDPNLLPHAYVAVRIAAVFLVFLLISNYMDSYVLYAGKFGMSLCMVAFESCIVPIACGVGLGFVFNMCGFWFGLALAPLAVLTVVLGYMFKRFGNPYMMPSGRDANIFVFDLELTAKKVAEVSEKVMRVLEQRGLYSGPAVRAPLIAEEALMIVMERNKGKRILSEVTLDLNDGVGLTLRDDGEIFDLTDSDANVSSLRSYLVANVMANQSSKFNLVTTGFNRNGFRF